MSIVADIITKKELRKNGFTFSNIMYETAKRKRTNDEILNKIVVQPESKRPKCEDIKSIINETLELYSENIMQNS